MSTQREYYYNSKTQQFVVAEPDDNGGFTLFGLHEILDHRCSDDLLDSEWCPVTKNNADLFLDEIANKIGTLNAVSEVLEGMLDG